MTEVGVGRLPHGALWSLRRTHRLVIDRRLRRLLSAQFATQAADVIATLALAQFVVFAAPRGASPASLAKLVLATFVPLIVAGPLAGRIADRYDHQRVLGIAFAARAVVTLVGLSVPYSGNRSLGYLVMAVAMGVSRIQYVCRAATLPALVRVEHLLIADSATMLTAMVAGSCGGIAGTVLAPRPGLALSIAAACHMYASFLVRSRSLRLEPCAPSAAGRLRSDERRTTFRHLISRATRFAIVSTCLHRSLLGVAFATFVLVADRRYHLSASGYAAAFALLGVGSFIGTLSAPMLAARLDRGQLAGFAYGIAACGFGSVPLLPHTGTVTAALVIAGFAFQNLRIAGDAAVQATTPHSALGRVFATYDLLYNASFIGGILLGLASNPAAHPARTFGVVACGYVVAGVALTIRGSRRTRRLV